MPARVFCALLAVSLAFGLAPVAASGPDVTVFELSGVQNHGADGGIRGYSVGTTSCNIGDAPLNWCDNPLGCGMGTTSRDHPVIAQNIYRLKNGRLDQIGASWLKHGFYSTNTATAGCLIGFCVTPPLDHSQLGIGCTDPYGATLNGSRPLGRKSEVNPTTGDFPFPYANDGSTTAGWNQRVAVADADLDAINNPGARYFVEGHYIAPDDALAGNGLNNASFQEVLVSAATLNLTMYGTTVRQKAAIEAWPLLDALVALFNVDVPVALPVQRFQVARRVNEIVPGTLWHYEYAVHNMNSNRAADRLSINFSGSPNFSNIGFHDVDAHSGEPYDTTDWTVTTSSSGIDWQAPPFAQPGNRNALRWATMYNFWFDADRPPGAIVAHSLGLLQGGAPTELGFLVVNPVFGDGFEN